jgi:hypothetical protein
MGSTGGFLMLIFDNAWLFYNLIPVRRRYFCSSGGELASFIFLPAASIKDSPGLEYLM